MESNELLAQLKAKFPEALLPVQRFGRTPTPLIWIEARFIADVAAWISDRGWNTLENLSIAQLDDSFIVSYFLRPSVVSSALIVLRVAAERTAEVPSVTGTWLVAGPYEREATELFGAKFIGVPAPEAGSGLLPEGFRGFPLRKDYVFPKEFAGVAHSRAPSDKAGTA